MEINQKLFDECTQSYKKERMRERDVINKRESLWTKIEEIASTNPSYSSMPHSDSESVGSNQIPEDGADMNEINLYERLEGPPEVNSKHVYIGVLESVFLKSKNFAGYGYKK